METKTQGDRIRESGRARSAGWPGALVLATGIICFIGATVLFFFDPAKSGFYPICYFHRLTGLLCPGCGGLRALHQLAHGNIAAAFKLNALLVVAMPVLFWVTGRALLRRARGQPAGFEISRRWFWIGLAVVIGFGIVRNLV